MKKFKMLLSVMALGVLLITNVVPVSAAEKIQSTKIESLSELDLDTYTQELMEADDGIQEQRGNPDDPRTVDPHGKGQ